MVDIAAPPLRIDAHVAGSIAVAHVAGEVDLATVDDLRTRLVALMDAPEVRELLVDVHEVAHFDSSGMRVLVELHQLARQRGGSLTVHRPTDEVYRLLALTGLTEILIVRRAPTRDEPSEPAGS